jgi:hypothetical protein
VPAVLTLREDAVVVPVTLPEGLIAVLGGSGPARREAANEKKSNDCLTLMSSSDHQPSSGDGASSSTAGPKSFISLHWGPPVLDPAAVNS